RDVHGIAVPTFENKTLLPRVEVLITDSVIKQLQQDGTYRIANENNADAILKAEISEISRTPARSLRGNVLATTEFNLAMHVKYKLETPSGTVLMPSTEVVGTTSFFVGEDVTTDERQALPLAAEELAIHLVTQLSEGW
ncbi:MAG: LPS assembly lipoprotein LptE, partial [Pseudolabrys sp.]